jgi:hypothetical protein
LATSSATELWDVLVDSAAAESSLWADVSLPGRGQRREPVFSTLCDPVYALGVETIYEGYLLHYGRPRLFAPVDDDTALLLGDYLYAHGLVRVVSTGNVEAVRDLAELISLCAQARAEERTPTAGGPDWGVWAATASLLGDGVLDAARAALRDDNDPSQLEAAARDASDDDALAQALAKHRLHTDISPRAG